MDGWEPLMCGWEPKSSQHLLVTQLRGYAVTHMLLYDQLYPIWARLFCSPHIFLLGIHAIMVKSTIRSKELILIKYFLLFF